MENLRETFEKVYRDNYAGVFGFIYNITNDWSLSEDITQEAFVKAYNNIDTFRNECKISVWINKIAYHLFLDAARKKAFRVLSTDDELLTAKLSEVKNNLAGEVEQKIMSDCVRSKILLIPENYRAPLFLDMHGYSNREIAGSLGCSLENAKIRLHRARRKMKDILGTNCSFYFDERNVLC